MAHRYKFAERRHVNGVTAVAAGTDYEGDELFGYAIDPDGQARELLGTGRAGGEDDFAQRLQEVKQTADMLAGHGDCDCAGWRDFNPPTEIGIR